MHPTDPAIEPGPAGRERRLESILQEIGSAVVAFSGGVDSTYLAFLARRTLGSRALAVTATSSTYPARELNEAVEFARRFGIPHEVIESEELAIPGFARNTPDRCYLCKKELFGKLSALASARGFSWVLDGSNADDVGDYRPGMRAAKELRVRSPLLEAGLTKADIRALSRERGLPTWDKPQAACLSSRFPYGTAITEERLSQVERGEEALRSLGFRQFRVRHHGEIARIEIGPAELPSALDPDMARRIVEAVKPAGFTYVTLDLQGYRTGSMNETLTSEAKSGRGGDP